MKILEGGLDNLNVETAGVKEGRYGIALIKFQKVCKAEAVYTTNKMIAAPLQVTRKKIRNGVRAIVANSGNANCSTGEKGLRDAEWMCQRAAKELGVDTKNVIVASTGIIGRYMDLDIVGQRIASASRNMGKHCLDAAKAIMTTDTAPKELCMDFGGFKIAGIAKGAGMIHPNMATMLCFIATDAAFEKGDLRAAVGKSFNMMSIDNDMSTNDMVVLVSAGSKRTAKFQEALTQFCREMAEMMIAGGEGVTKVIRIEVNGAKSEADAKKAARTIADSYLVKAAVFGNNPNWGRVAAAVGYSGAEVVSEKMRIWYEVAGKSVLLYDGFAKEFDKKGLGDEMQKNSKIKIIVDLGLGKGSAKAWSGDLSYDYVRINAEYN